MMKIPLQLALGACLTLLCSHALGAQPGFLTPRSYYLTPSEYLGDEVLGACADEYHFASLFEIHDTSSMRYNFELGLTWEESGYGLPSYREGWIRADGEGPNCDNWSSGANPDLPPYPQGHLGPVGVLVPGEIYLFDQPPPAPGGDGWDFHPHPCWIPASVWCVSD
jgi:hypothetical protein